MAKMHVKTHSSISNYENANQNHFVVTGSLQPHGL